MALGPVPQDVTLFLFFFFPHTQYSASGRCASGGCRAASGAYRFSKELAYRVLIKSGKTRTFGRTGGLSGTKSALRVAAPYTFHFQNPHGEQYPGQARGSKMAEVRGVQNYCQKLRFGWVLGQKFQSEKIGKRRPICLN